MMKKILIGILLIIMILFALDPGVQKVNTLKVFPVDKLDSLGNKIDSTEVVLITDATVGGLLDSLTILNNTPLDSITKQEMLYKFIERHVKAKNKK